jgi:hypothetical protein
VHFLLECAAWDTLREKYLAQLLTDLMLSGRFALAAPAAEVLTAQYNALLGGTGGEGVDNWCAADGSGMRRVQNWWYATTLREYQDALAPAAPVTGQPAVDAAPAAGGAGHAAGVRVPPFILVARFVHEARKARWSLFRSLCEASTGGDGGVGDDWADDTDSMSDGDSVLDDSSVEDEDVGALAVEHGLSPVRGALQDAGLEAVTEGSAVPERAVAAVVAAAVAVVAAGVTTRVVVAAVMTTGALPPTAMLVAGLAVVVSVAAALAAVVLAAVARMAAGAAAAAGVTTQRRAATAAAAVTEAAAAAAAVAAAAVAVAAAASAAVAASAVAGSA